MRPAPGPRKLYRFIKKTNEKCNTNEKVDWCVVLGFLAFLDSHRRPENLAMFRLKETNKTHEKSITRGPRQREGGQMAKRRKAMQLKNCFRWCCKLSISWSIFFFCCPSIAVSNAQKVANRKSIEFGGGKRIGQKVENFSEMLINIYAYGHKRQIRRSPGSRASGQQKLKNLNKNKGNGTYMELHISHVHGGMAETTSAVANKQAGV